MIKRLLIFSIAMSMMLSAPLFVSAAEAEMISQEQTIEDDISISVNGQFVTINGAQGLTLEVVSLPKGCYILKIGKVVRKVAIR